MSIPSIPDIMTVEEFATYLRVSAKTVRRIIASGELAVIRVHSMTRITREAVAAYLTDQTRKTTQCPQHQSQKANARKTGRLEKRWPLGGRFDSLRRRCGGGRNGRTAGFL